MRWQALHLRAFAAHEDLVLEPLDKTSMHVFLGPNEAGKSSVFRAVRAVLFGVPPSTEDRPWSGRPLELFARWVEDDGTQSRLTRRLRSRPSARLEQGERVLELANRPVPFLSGLDEATFDSLYAFDLGELLRLRGTALRELEERTFEGGLRHDLRSSRETIERLEQERRRLHRADRRAKPRSRELQELLRERRRERAEAQAADRERRERTAEREVLERELAELGPRQRELEHSLSLIPLARGVAALSALEEERRRVLASPIPADLPADPREEGLRRRQATEHARRRFAELDTRLGELERRAEVAAADPCLEALADLERALERLGSRPARLRALEHARSREVERERQLEERAREFSADAAEEQGESARRFLERMPRTRELRAVVERRDRLAEERKVAQEEERAVRLRAAAAVVAAVLFAGLGLAGARVQQTTFAVLGLLLAGSALGFAGFLEQRLRRDREAREDLADRRREELEEKLERALRGAETSLDLEDWDVATIDRLEHLGERHSEWRSLGEERSALERELRLEEREIQQLCGRVGIGGASPPERKSALEAKLREVRREEAGLRSFERERPALVADRDSRRADLEALEAEAEEFEERVRRIAGGSLDLPESCRRIGEARALDTRIRALRQELESRDPKWRTHALEVAERQRRGERFDLDEESRLREERAAVESARFERTRRVGEIDEILRSPLRSPADVDGEILGLEAELAEVHRSHDRMALLEAALRLGVERFRDRHQSDVLQRAGRLLEQLTEGRYRRLLVEGLEQQLFLAGPAAGPDPRPLVSGFSRGTQDQVQWCLRLALAEHFDAERGEALPLFLDEAFVQFDLDRTRRALEVLAGEGARRQVFLFTCHAAFAELAAKVAGARVWSIDSRAPERARAAGGS